MRRRWASIGASLGLLALAGASLFVMGQFPSADRGVSVNKANIRQLLFNGDNDVGAIDQTIAYATDKPNWVQVDWTGNNGAAVQVYISCSRFLNSDMRDTVILTTISRSYQFGGLASNIDSVMINTSDATGSYRFTITERY